MFEVYFDGSAVPNPGQMYAGVFCPQTSFTLSLTLGMDTNNIAEWSALLYALPYAASLLPYGDVFVLGDSMLVIKAMQNQHSFEKSDHHWLYKLCEPFLALRGLSFAWVSRDYNLAHKYAMPMKSPAV